MLVLEVMETVALSTVVEVNPIGELYDVVPLGIGDKVEFTVEVQTTQTISHRVNVLKRVMMRVTGREIVCTATVCFKVDTHLDAPYSYIEPLTTCTSTGDSHVHTTP